MPDEWQARRATPAILQVSISKHNAKTLATRVRGPVSSVHHCHPGLTEEKREENEFTKPVCVHECMRASMSVCLSQDLAKLGVKRLGHNARLLKAIKKLPEVPFARDVPVSQAHTQRSATFTPSAHVT